MWVTPTRDPLCLMGGFIPHFQIRPEICHSTARLYQNIHFYREGFCRGWAADLCMLTRGGLRTEAAVMWGRCCSHQALKLQKPEADPTEPEPDEYRTSHRPFSIYVTNQAGWHNCNFFCTQVTVALEDSIETLHPLQLRLAGMKTSLDDLILSLVSAVTELKKIGKIGRNPS